MAQQRWYPVYGREKTITQCNHYFVKFDDITLEEKFEEFLETCRDDIKTKTCNGMQTLNMNEMYILWEIFIGKKTLDKKT